VKRTGFSVDEVCRLSAALLRILAVWPPGSCSTG